MEPVAEFNIICLESVNTDTLRKIKKALRTDLTLTQIYLLLKNNKPLLENLYFTEAIKYSLLLSRNRINASIDVKRSVIATGGSVIYGKEAMEHLKKIGVVVYIKLPYEEIAHRLGNLEQRGVAIKNNQTLEDLYNERVPLYEKYADIVCEEKNMTISQTALFIRDKLKEFD